ncbi:Peroxisome biogenesis protein 2 [Gossypium arboreum]|uniref:RING-type E3 ubiquitin transferase (cysteine targeting) n=1 Tax=Gossypium arboreum TaxID=29729 RepID=A0A0B0MVT3_GOSAR|nr:Peroxisome biogenesis protein 2 [Gossypium arboreum]
MPSTTGRCLDYFLPKASSSLALCFSFSSDYFIYTSAILQHSTISISVSRVNQFDAARLDIEMSAMLKEQLVKVFSLMKPGMLFQYQPELNAFLEFLIWRFSIWVDKPTPGIAFMNLRYRDERAVALRGKVRTGLEGPGLTFAQKMWYCVAAVGGQYIWARLQSFSAFCRWGDSEEAIGTASLGFDATYRNLIERSLQGRLVYESPNMNRAVSFEYMNRQLVWNEFSVILVKASVFLHPFSKDKSSSSKEDDSICPICRASPTLAYLALPCQHRYCYYCLRTRFAAVPSFQCSRCGEPVVAMQQHGSVVT